MRGPAELERANPNHAGGDITGGHAGVREALERILVHLGSPLTVARASNGVPDCPWYVTTTSTA